jgi:hypothetical protein
MAELAVKSPVGSGTLRLLTRPTVRTNCRTAVIAQRAEPDKEYNVKDLATQASAIRCGKPFGDYETRNR